MRRHRVKKPALADITFAKPHRVGRVVGRDECWGLKFSLGAHWLAALLLAVVLIALPEAASAERSVKLAWNPSPDASVSGYNVYAWEENASSPIRIDAGATNFAVVSGLKEGLRYVFHVTAYTPYGLESLPSEGLPFTVPVPLTVTPPSVASVSPRLRFPAAPGRWYEVQASTDLIHWSTIWQTGIANNYSWIEYQDPRIRYYKSRFYRLQVH